MFMMARMVTNHAASVFTNSCLATPRDPVTNLPSARVEHSKGSHQEPEMAHHSVYARETSRPSTTPGLRHFKKHSGGEESFQTSLAPDTPYVRPATVSSSRSPELAAGGRKGHGLYHDPSRVAGNERSAVAREESYATLFATLLESNTLLREEIQKLREETKAAVGKLRPQSDESLSLTSDSDNDDEISQNVPPKLLENTWVEPSTDQDESRQPSCLASSLSLPASADDQHEYGMTNGHIAQGVEEEAESCITVEEVNPDQLHLDSSSGSSSRLSSPSAEIEGDAHVSRSTESLLSDSSTSSASADDEVRGSGANDPFASPGMLAVKSMWSDFSVEDYSPRSFGEEEDSRAKARKKEWTPKITIPKPFSMTIRESNSPKRKSKSMIQAEQERLEREAQEEAELKKQFRATPLPANTYLPLYELINAKNEQRRREVKMLSQEMLKSTERPFSFMKRENEKKLMKNEELRRSQMLERKKQSEVMFHANPIPKHVFDPDVNERLKEQEEYREIRIKLRAQELLALSKLPGSMQLKGREYSLGALRRKRMEENENKAFMTDEHKFHPSVTDSVPDYDRAYMEFQKQLALRKKAKHITATEPFYLRTALIPSRKEQVVEDIERDRDIQLQNRWLFKTPRPKESSKSPKHVRSKSGGVPYPSQLTKTAKVRFSLTQEKLASELQREREKEMEQRERMEKQQTLKKSVAQKSYSHDPSVWLEDRKRKKCQEFR